MGTVNVVLGKGTRLNLILGQQLENAVTEVVFDFSAWQTTYGSGTLALSVQRPGDDQPYAVTMTTSGTDATWSVTNLDTAYKGVGHIQLTYTVGTAIKKSVVYKFTVYESLGANGEYPSPGQTWQQNIEAEIGTLSNLPTTDKSSLVASINEIDGDITDVKQDLNGITGIVTNGLEYDEEITIVDTGTCIIDNVNTGVTVDITPTTSAQFIYSLVECSEGDIFKITGTGGDAVRLWAFTDSSYVMVSKADANITLTDGIITAPSNGYLICNFNKNKSHSLFIKKYIASSDFLELQNESSNVSNIVDGLEYYEDIEVINTGTGIKTNGAIGSTVDITPVTSQFFSKTVECTKGDIFKVTGTGGDSYRLWCFTDESYKMLSKANANVSMTDGVLVAPADGYLICDFNGNLTYGLKIRKYVTSQVVEDIKDLQSDIVAINQGGRCIFGAGNTLDYRVTGISAYPNPNSPLSYFYGLFDDLASAYPEYITKINCDTDAGITQPSYMADYPIYLYKFVPPYTPKTSGSSLDNTAGSVLKVMIVGGTHPEYTAMDDLYHTMRLICEKWDEDDNLFELRFVPTFYVFPCEGAYGVENKTRTNYNGVDLNRNMPTKGWKVAGAGTSTYTGPTAGSEYETQILLHYIDELKPQIFIDHHNSSLADAESLMYITSMWQICVDVGCDHIQRMSKKWQITYPETFGTDTTKIYGFCKKETENGDRARYACENGMFGFTYESQQWLCYYDGGEFDGEGVEHYTAMVETLATDGFLNFLLNALNTFSRYSLLT